MLISNFNVLYKIQIKSHAKEICFWQFYQSYYSQGFFCVPNLRTRECSSTKQASDSKFHTQHLQNALAQIMATYWSLCCPRPISPVKKSISWQGLSMCMSLNRILCWCHLIHVAKLKKGRFLLFDH